MQVPDKIIPEKTGYALLESASDAQLKEWLTAFPYCSNLHIIALKKAVRSDAKKDINYLLSNASTYTTDRTHLYEQYSQVWRRQEPLEKPQMEETETTAFELKGIEEQEEKLQSLYVGTPVHQEPVEPEKNKVLNLLSNSDFDWVTASGDEVEEDYLLEDGTFVSTENFLVEEEMDSGRSMLEKILEADGNANADLVDFEQLDFWITMTKVLNSPTLILDPRPKSQKFQGNSEIVLEIVTDEPKSKIRKPFSHSGLTNERSLQQNVMIKKEQEDNNSEEQEPFVEKMAEKSIAESREIVSETLAELLVAQEQYEKGIQMYERLILAIPEKSTFFAEKIQELKKLILQ